MNQLFSTRELLTLVRTLEIALTTGTIATTVGTSIALITNLYLTRYKKIIDFTFLITLLIPPLFQAIAWLNAYYYLARLGVISLQHLPLLRSPAGVITILTISNIPIAYFFAKLALESIPTTTWQSALLTKPAKQLLGKFIFPALKQSAVISLLLITVFAFNTFDVPAFYEVNVYITEIFSQFSAHFNTNRALFLSLIPMLFSLVVSIGIYARFLKDKPIFGSGKSYNLQTPRIKTGVVTIVGTVITIAIIFIGCIFPIISILHGSNLPNITFWQDLSASQDSIIATIALMLFTTPVLVTSGLIGARFLHQPIIRPILFTLLTFPAITYGIVLIYTFNRNPLNIMYGTPLLLINAYTLRFFPIMVELMASQINRVNPHLIWVAKLQQTSKAQLIQQILFPLYLPAITIGSALAAWFVVTELPITLLLQPPGSQTLISRVFILLHYGSQTTMNTLIVAIIALGIIPLIILRRKIQSSDE